MSHSSKLLTDLLIDKSGDVKILLADEKNLVAVSYILKTNDNFKKMLESKTDENKTYTIDMHQYAPDNVKILIYFIYLHEYKTFKCEQKDLDRLLKRGFRRICDSKKFL